MPRAGDEAVTEDHINAGIFRIHGVCAAAPARDELERSGLADELPAPTPTPTSRTEEEDDAPTPWLAQAAR